MSDEIDRAAIDIAETYGLSDDEGDAIARRIRTAVQGTDPKRVEALERRVIAAARRVARDCAEGGDDPIQGSHIELNEALAALDALPPEPAMQEIVRDTEESLARIDEAMERREPAGRTLTVQSTTSRALAMRIAEATGRTDTARFDWLEEQDAGVSIFAMDASVGWEVNTFRPDGPFARASTPRAAIDAAMDAEEDARD